MFYRTYATLHCEVAPRLMSWVRIEHFWRLSCEYQYRGCTRLMSWVRIETRWAGGQLLVAVGCTRLMSWVRIETCEE